MGLRKTFASFAYNIGFFLSSKLPAFSRVPVYKHDLLREGEGNHAKIPPTQAELSVNETQFSKTAAPRLFALLIGINTYNSLNSTSSSRATAIRRNSEAPDEQLVFTNLRGAVGDAEQFRDYLVTHLLVPSSHINFLSEEHATRENIIAAFRKLATDMSIQKGDSIFIFYAGHGAQAYPPKRLLEDPGCPERVELLIPFDYSKDPSNSHNMGIPDYSLATLLNNIAKEKGDNITIVFDCCHSAGALRGGARATLEEEDILVRSGPELTYHVPDDLDEDIWGPRKRGLTAPLALKYMGTSSYVFLAACTSSEMAKEKSNRGYFTTALLEYLKQNPQIALKASCSQVITDLKIEGQNPQCEGLQSDKRPIFHAYTPPYGKRFFDFCAGSKRGSKPSFILKGGEAHGLAGGDELVVYANKLQNENQPIGTIVLTTVSIDTSSFQLKTGSRRISLSDYPQATAVLHKSAITMDKSQSLAIYVDPLYSELAERVKVLGGSVLVENVDKAHIHISTAPGKQLCFKVVDAALSGVELKPQYTADTDEDLSHVLRGLSHYYHHLKRSSTSLPTDRIFLSLFQVKDNGHGHPRVVRTEDSMNLISQDTQTAHIVVQDDEEAIYGLEITNGTERDEKLFPVLLYFDNVDFTITRSFPHTVILGRETDSPWPAKGRSMTIGYGIGPGSSIHPFSFYLSDGNNVEAGFFKLFLFETPIDLQSVEQDRPLFTITRGMKPMSLPTASNQSTRWGAITFSVIQRRG